MPLMPRPSLFALMSGPVDVQENLLGMLALGATDEEEPALAAAAATTQARDRNFIGVEGSGVWGRRDGKERCLNIIYIFSCTLGRRR